MSGHAILDSCHNCGSSSEKLFVVRTSTDDRQDDMDLGCAENYHHIHVFAACADCKKRIWKMS